jgi:repressor of nif and glnA expression
MNGFHMDDRDLALLGIVGEGGGQHDARRIDITFSRRHDALGDKTVLEALQILQEAGLVSQRVDIGGVGGRWSVTAEGATVLRRTAGEEESLPDEDRGSRPSQFGIDADAEPEP